MRALPTLSACLALLALPALADTPQKPGQHHRTTGPQAIGTFEDWTAATNKEAGQTVCYAFTRARASTPALPGRGDVVLTVTERASGRDAVAISAGFAFAANATAKLAVDGHSFDLYTAQRSAFARDGHAAAKAMEHGHEAVAHLPGPKGAEIADTFSLRGFDKAYAAIVKRCPPGKPAA
ncbi:MAG TPA: invasion associated locus B family protein [Acetobacteraceae bacterium]|nr:invasion associated locus B family protein [Acetobacteraceae bacterium]